jgi:L-seryl-tRNA(Ser) seleniumtransferase
MSAAVHEPAGDATDIRRSLGARTVINLTGTLTALGGISARPEAAAAAAAMMTRGVDIVELQACASRIIAEATGAEAGFVAACSSAGICMAVAGAMTGDDLARIERLPDTEDLRNEVVIQTGHLVNYGHPIAQDVRQTGARVVAFGAVNAAPAHQLEGAIGPRTAAGLYVVSHHCAPDGQLGFDDFVGICHERGVPVIVDLAAEYALHAYLDAGADVTIHSAHKFLGGATAGIVCGRKALIRAAYLQTLGIGRPMKVGKEAIAAALVALRSFLAEDRDAVRAGARRQLLQWRERFVSYPGIRAEIDADPTGNPFDRLRVTVDAEQAGIGAVELVRRLEAGDPSIRVRTHQLEHGSFVMDPRSLGEGELELVAERVCSLLDAAARGEARCDDDGIHRWRLDRAAILRRWPDITAEQTA